MIVLDSKKEEKVREVTVEGPFGAHDTLRHGIKSISHDLAPKHPLQSHLLTAMESDEKRRMIVGERTLGLHMSMRIATEKSLFKKNARLCGLPSSNLGLEILTGQDEDFDISDFLNLPNWSPDRPTDHLIN